MCGIAGIVSYDVPAYLNATRAREIGRRLRHRGPDDDGVHLGSSAVLSHTRLALIDPQGGRQPLSSADGRHTIVYNGEVYNFRELRQELRGNWDFRTDCDTEVVLAAYVDWGPECLERLNGMFSFFVWDEKDQVGFAARDLLGVKPFAYAYDGRELLFASEAQALLSARPTPPKASREALLEYLVAPYFSGVEQSMFEDVEYLQPGHTLDVSRDGVTIQRWGEYDLRGDFMSDTRRLTERLSESVTLAVERALIADAPVSAYLSGGVDSTLVTSVAARASEAPLPAFTIRFEDQELYDYEKSLIVTSDDTPFAIHAAEELGVRHHVVPVERSRLVRDLSEIARINDALPAWEQELAQYHLAKVASAHSKAVLVGDAADETHYGYHFLLDDEVTRSPAGFLSRFYCAPLRPDVLHDPIAHFERKYLELTTAAGFRQDTPLERTLATTYLIVRRWLPRLLHNGDIHSMASSLEARVPFADIDLLYLARRVHPHAAYHNGEEKRLLREAARGHVPETIRTRRKSALPKDQRVAAMYQEEALECLEESRDFLGEFLLLNQIARLCDPTRALSEAERALLFRVIVLSHWTRAHGVAAP